MKPRIKARRDGGFDINVPDEEQRLVASLAPQLRELLVGSPDDPSLQRLFPPAYPDDAERNADYRALVADELLGEHLQSLDLLEEAFARDRLDEEELAQCLRALNALRLVLGTRLDIGEERHVIDPDDPDAGAHAVYDYLTFLVSEIVDALAGW